MPPDTDAKILSLLVHIPPVVALDNVVVEPAHTLVTPVIGSGNGFTRKLVVALQPLANEYVIVVVPAVTPVTIPVALPTDATAILADVHDPPPELLRVALAPTHVIGKPLIAVGSVFTAIVLVAIQPVGNV
jgi:hypothetical protein